MCFVSLVIGVIDSPVVYDWGIYWSYQLVFSSSRYNDSALMVRILFLTDMYNYHK